MSFIYRACVLAESDPGGLALATQKVNILEKEEQTIKPAAAGGGITARASREKMRLARIQTYYSQRYRYCTTHPRGPGKYGYLT